MSYSFARVPPFLLNEPAEEWARYYFDHPASPDEPSDEPFATDSASLYKIKGPSDEEGIARIILVRIAELYERYAEWTPHYSAAQLSQGMCAMFGFPGSFEQFLLDEELPFGARARAMRSLVTPYRVYVNGWNPEDPMPYAWDMLWDGIFYNKNLHQDISEVGLECLQEILALPDQRCQAYALHGLNHLDHPSRPEVVQHWMDTHRNEEWDWSWVEACRDGQAM